MSLLMRPVLVKQSRKRGRWGVRRIVYQVPKYEKHTLEWWQQWLVDHWE